MIISPSSLDTNLSQLLDEVNTGKTQLPEFQRDWTWDDGRICGIIASLSQGYPMGAIMRLQYGNPEIKFKYRTIKSVGELNVVPDFLVLDGQQRLTSIYSTSPPIGSQTSPSIFMRTVEAASRHCFGVPPISSTAADAAIADATPTSA